MLFGTDVIPFLTQPWLMPYTPATSDGAGNSWSISLSELLTPGMGMSSAWQAKGLGGAVKKNLRDNGPMAIGTIIGAALINKGLRKVGVYRSANRLIRSAGLGAAIKF
jgi:hypothetical protein